MKYKVIEAANADELQESVQDHLNQGWQLQGGVAIAGWYASWENERKGYTENETRYAFAQAMTRP